MNIFDDIIKNSEQREFVNDVVSLLANKNEITMSYKGKQFVVDPHGNSIEVYSEGRIIACYPDAVDFLMNHRINGQKIIELYFEIYYSI